MTDATLMGAKPSFVAPSQPLEKSLQELIQGTDLAVATSSEMDSNMAPCTPKDKKKKKEKRRSKEPSPEAIKATEAPSSEIVVNPAVVSEQSLSAGGLFRLSSQNPKQNDFYIFIMII